MTRKSDGNDKIADVEDGIQKGWCLMLDVYQTFYLKNLILVFRSTELDDPYETNEAASSKFTLEVSK